MKIALHQRVNGNKDPVLTITLTDNEAYMRGCRIIPNSDLAIALVERWMKGKLDASKNSKVEKDIR